jgi:transposase
MHSKAATRRRHSGELKAKVLIECEEPGASVAAVAQAHGLNANLVHKWRRERRPQAAANEATTDDKVASAFVALQLPAPPTPQPAPDIRIELRRGATTITIAWPGQAAGQCAEWLAKRVIDAPGLEAWDPRTGAASAASRARSTAGSPSPDPETRNLKLIGMLDSHYARRVAISMRSLGLRIEHQPLSVQGCSFRIPKQE